MEKVIFKIGEESKAKDPRLCSTVVELMEYTCKKVKATAPSILRNYRTTDDTGRRMLVTKAFMVATQGQISGEIHVYVGLDGQIVMHKHKSGWMYSKTDATKPIVFLVIIYFITNPEQAFYLDLTMEPPKVKLNRKQALYTSDSHAAVLIVDPVRKEADYSDPHGYAPWNAFVYPELRKAVHANIKLLPPWDTCPNLGVQRVYNAPICGYFSSVYAFLRLRCPQVPPLQLQTFLSRLGRQRLIRLIRGWACFLDSLQ